MMGQRDLYNPEALAEFEKALSLGCTYTLACAAAGWSYRAYREWMVAAEKGEPKYSALPAVVARARANRAKRWLASIEKAAAVDWKAAAWKLERLEREEYGREAAVRFVGEALRVDVRTTPDAVRAMTDDELREALARLEG